MEMTMERGAVGLAIAAHPLRPEVEHRFVCAGGTLAETLRSEGVNGDAWVVSVGGIDVPPEYWERIRVKPGHLIECRAVVRKQVLQLAAIVALTYFTMGVGGIAGGSFIGLTGAVGAMAAGAAFVGGTLVINKLLAPAAARIGGGVPERSQSYGISGGRNTPREYQPLGLMLGECKVVPDLAGQQFTWFDGDDQYLACMLHGGINCGAVSDLRLGETLLSTYANVKVTRSGFPAGNNGPMPSMSVDSVAGGALERKTDAESEWTTRTTSRNTVRIAVDLEATLSSVSNSGKWEHASLDLDAEYRVVGGAWLPFAEGRITLTNASGKPVRRTIVIDVAPQQYEVRLRKVTRNATSTQHQNAVAWPTMKSYQADPSDYAGQPRVLLEVKATGQLSGALDSVSWIGRAAAMPVWTGEEWITATEPGAAGVSNPGAQILMLMRGIRRESDGRLIAGMGLPDSKIDMESLKAFMVRCRLKKFRFDDFVQEAMNLGTLLDAIADVGFGRISRGSGKYGVVWLAEDQPIRGIINMATMKARNFSVDYDLLPTAEEAQADFYDRSKGYSKQSIRVTSPLAAATPDRQASSSLRGITVDEHAGQRLRMMLGQSAYARKSVSWDMDLEYLTHRAGSLVALSHDLTQWGYSGRVISFERAVGSWTIGLDVELPEVGGRVHMMALVLPRENRMRVYPVGNVSADRRSVTIRQSWPADLPAPGDGADVLDVIWLYDVKPTPGYRCRIVSVQPNSGMTGARVTAVPEAPELWEYVWSGNWTQPVGDSLLAQLPPTAGNATVTAELTRFGEAWQTTLTVSFDASGNFDHAQIWAAVGDAPLEMVAQVSGVRASWAADRGQRWRVEVRPFDSLGRMGTAALAEYAVAESAASEVLGLRVSMTEQGAEASWMRPDGIQGVDWSITEVRTGPEWRFGSVAFSGRADLINLGWLPFGRTLIWASHRNTAGEWSNPVSAHIDVVRPSEPLIGTGRDQSTIRLEWQDCRTSQPLRGYRILRGPALAGATALGSISATTYTRTEAAGGLQRYWVVAEDVAGNLSDAGTAQVEVLPTAESVLAGLNLETTELGKQLLDVIGSTEGVNGEVAKLAKDVVAGAGSDIKLAGDIQASEQRQILALQKATVELRSATEVVAADLQAKAADIAGNAAKTAQEIANRLTQGATLGGQISSVSEAVGTQARRVDALGSRVDGVDSHVIALWQADASHAVRMDALQVKTTGLATQVTETAEATGDLAQRVVALSAAAADVDSAITDLSKVNYGNAQTLRALRVKSGQAESSVRELTSVTAAQATRQIELQSKLGTAETNIALVNQTTSTLATQQYGLVARVDGAEGRIARSESVQAQQASRLSTMEVQGSSNTGRIHGLETVSASTVSRTDALEVRAGGFGASIDALQKVSPELAMMLVELRAAAADQDSQFSDLRKATTENVSAVRRLQMKSGFAESGILRVDKLAAGLATTVQELSARNVGVEAAVKGEAVARANGDGALAARVDQVTATANGASAAVQVVQSAQATTDGKLAAMFGVKIGVTVDGKYYQAGIGAGVENTPGGMQTQVYALADRFAVLNLVNGAVATPFVIENGQVVINTALIGNASIGTLQLAGESVTIPRFVQFQNSTFWTAHQTQVFAYQLYLPAAATVLIACKAAPELASDIWWRGYYRVYVNGVERFVRLHGYKQPGQYALPVGVDLQFCVRLEAGSHNIAATWQVVVGPGMYAQALALGGTELFVLGTMR